MAGCLPLQESKTKMTNSSSVFISYVYHISNGHALVSTLCRICMDFTILEAGNRVNLMEAKGPY